MQGLPGATIGSVVERMAPMLDILVNGSPEANINRAAQCASVATEAPRNHPRSKSASRRPPQRAAQPGRYRSEPGIRLVGAQEVARLKREEPVDRAAPRVDFSLFVQLDQDLDPKARAAAVAEVVKLQSRQATSGTEH